MIEIKNLFKKYKVDSVDNVDVLKDINVSFKEKGLYVIYGPSGEGKTTFLNCIFGSEKYDSGEILFNSKKINNLRELNATYITQNYGLLHKLSVKDNIMLSLSAYKIKKSEEDILSKLDEFGVKDLYLTKVKYLSGGEKAKVALARSFLMNSKIVLLDEPTASLDKDSKEYLYDAILKYSKNFLFIVVSHDDKMIEIASNKLFIKEGHFENFIEESNLQEEVKISKKNSLLLFKYFFKKKNFYFFISIILLILCSAIVAFFNSQNIDTSSILKNELLERDIRHASSKIDLTKYGADILKYDENYFLERTYYYDIKYQSTDKYANVEYNLPVYFVCDETLPNDAVIVSDFALDVYLNKGIVERIGEETSWLSNAVGQSFYLKGDSFKIQNYYKTKYETYEFKSDAYYDYIENEDRFIYLNDYTLNHIKSIFDDDLSIIIKVNSKTTYSFNMYNENYVISDSIKYIDSSKSEFTKELGENECVLNYQAFGNATNLDSYIGQSYDFTFTVNKTSFVKNLKIVGIDYSTTKGIYLSNEAFSEIYKEVNSNSYLMSTYELNNINARDLLNNILEYSLDKNENNYINFGINEDLLTLKSTLDKIKIMFSNFMYIDLVIIVLSVIAISMFISKMYENEMDNFLSLGYSYNETFNIIRIFVLIELFILFIMSILTCNITINILNNNIKNTCNTLTSCLSNYSLIDFVIYLGFGLIYIFINEITGFLFRKKLRK